MTLPDERYRSVVQTKTFLEDILMGKYARVPSAVKERARSCLRHYPNSWDMQQAAESAPSVFQERMEPLYRMVKQHEQDQQQ